MKRPHLTINRTLTIVGIRTLIWGLCLLMLAPPALLAQTMGGIPPQQPPPAMGQPGAGGLPGQPGIPGMGTPSQPGGAMLTNPNALMPLFPSQTPCPGRNTPDFKAEQTLQSLNEFWPMETSKILPSALEQRMRQERQEIQEKVQKQLDEKWKKEKAAEQQQTQGTGGFQMQTQQQQPPPIGAPPQGAQQGQGGMQGQQTQEEQKPTAPDASEILTKNFTLEESFAKFSVLQGVAGRLKQYGYEFFDSQAATGFAPVLDTPVGPDYVIGPQDSLAIHIWNVPDSAMNKSYIAPVERDGTLVIPQFGAIPISGLTFSQAEKVIHSKLATMLKRFEVHVAMARLRTIKLFVVGEVVRPGAYEVSSLSTVSNAIYSACGPSRSGSLRNMRVMRDGKTIATVDFYDFLLSGDRSQDIRLQAGDVVVVPPIGPVSAISGAVKRSAIYEMKSGTRLTEALRLAGGLTSIADRQRCHIYRLEPGVGRMIVDVDLVAAFRAAGETPGAQVQSDANPLIRDGDYIRITSLPTQVVNAVSLAGAVKSPGPYEFKPGMKVGDIITPDQLTIDAYADRAEIIRTDPVTYTTKVIQFSPRAIFSGKQAENYPLQRLDQIVVASQVRPPNLVSIEGEVKRPGYFTVEASERLSSVLKRAGGFTQSAFPPGIILIRASVKQKQQAELDRFVMNERQRLAAQSGAVAAGTAGIAGSAALTTSGSIAEVQVLQLRLQQLEATAGRVELGRVVIRMTSIESMEGTEDDIRLEAEDKITIPQPPQTVNIIGSVKNPSNVMYRPGLNLNDYLEQAGGATEEANLSEVYITRANGSTLAAYYKIKDMQPGDTIIVPQKIESKTPTASLWQSIAGIVSAAMISIAAIAVIGR